jgi:general secretion pathway protein J
MDLESLVVLQTPRYQKPEFNSAPDPYRFIGREETKGQKIVSSMVFTSFAHAMLGADQRAGVARIAYYLRENQNHAYDLYRADSLFPFSEEIESCTDPVLCRDISGFEIVFTDFNGDEHPYWDSDSQEFRYTVPARIDLKITLGSDETQQVFETAVFLSSGRGPIE